MTSSAKPAPFDVHVRRLRAKLGTEYESLIGTVRNVGYKAVRPSRGAGSAANPDLLDDIDDFCAAPSILREPERIP